MSKIRELLRISRSLRVLKKKKLLAPRTPNVHDHVIHVSRENSRDRRSCDSFGDYEADSCLQTFLSSYLRPLLLA